MSRICVATTLLAACGMLAPAPAVPFAPVPAAEERFTRDFDLSRCTFSSLGGNDFFILDPGHFLVLEGESHGELENVVITVLDETRSIGGIECRVIEEVETADGELVEISRNYFAMCNETGDVFYFGEDVDDYEDGEIVGHGGAWLAFEDGNLPGILMPGRVLHGSRHYQEVAPGIAEDRAEILDLDEVVRTVAGTFTGCIKVEESTPLEPGHFSYKTYAPGIGLVRDGKLKLIAWGG